MAPKTKGTKRGSEAQAASPHKKARASADPELAAVLEAIWMASDLPDGCRSMLEAALPHGLGVTKAERTAAQTQSVEMVEEAMASVETALEAAADKASAELKEVHESKGQLQGNSEAAGAALAVAVAALTAKTEALAAADAELKAAKALHTEKQTGHKSIEKDFEKANNDKEAYEALIVTEFAALKDGTWEKKADASKMCRQLEKLAAPLNLETSLTTALPGVFTKKPDERGAFEKIVVETLEKHLREQVEKLTKMLADWPAAVAERAAAAEGASSRLDAATEAKNAAQASLTEAKTGKAAAAKDLKDAEHKVTNYIPNLEAAAKKKDANDAALKNFRNHNKQCFSSLKDKVAKEPEEVAPPAEEAADVPPETEVTVVA